MEPMHEIGRGVRFMDEVGRKPRGRPPVSEGENQDEKGYSDHIGRGVGMRMDARAGLGDRHRRHLYGNNRHQRRLHPAEQPFS